MLEYSKMILEKVSFEPRIFRKELRKALRQSSQEEIRHLIAWCKEKFKNKRLSYEENNVKFVKGVE